MRKQTGFDVISENIGQEGVGKQVLLGRVQQYLDAGWEVLSTFVPQSSSTAITITVTLVKWEEVYSDSFYGTLKSEINRIWADGKVVIFDVDVVGGLNLKSFFGTNALSLFIAPPSISILETRLRNRKTETEDKIQQRLDKSRIELSRANEFDIVIRNVVLNDAIEEARTSVLNFIK